ncbi:hypothetical protein [Arachidicoccus sp.]
MKKLWMSGVNGEEDWIRIIVDKYNRVYRKRRRHGYLPALFPSSLHT